MSDPEFYRHNTADEDKKLDADKHLVNGVEVFRLRSVPGPANLCLDQVDANTLYIGEALPGTAESAAAWRIRKLVTSGTVTTIKFAGGTPEFVNVWNNRASLSYSS